MSKTPRIDEKEFKLYDESLSVPASVVRSSFARELETELAEARAEIVRLRGELIRQIQPEEYVLSTYSATAEPVKNAKDALIEQMREALRGVCEKCPGARCKDCDVGAALDAAERGEG